MAFDYKKEYKEYYMPKNTPQIVQVTKMNFLAVRGVGDPNEKGGAYQDAIGLLYGIAFTIKMSKKGSHKIDGYFDYVVPPLLLPIENLLLSQNPEVESLKSSENRFFSNNQFRFFLPATRIPPAAEKKKKQDFSKVEFLTIEEGLCVQCMHIGPFDDEPGTIARMDQYLLENGYENDFSKERFHHEIYLSDARRVAPEKWRTVIRHPIK